MAGMNADCADSQGTGKLSRIELWAGLLDFGYTIDEIAIILDIASPERCVADFE